MRIKSNQELMKKKKIPVHIHMDFLLISIKLNSTQISCIYN